MLRTYNVAVVGATGAVGTKILETLEKRNFPVNVLKVLSSKRSAGAEIHFRGNSYKVEEAKPESFDEIDIALFSAGGSVSAALAPEAVKRGAVVIDNTSHFRMSPEVPLVVPEVNPEDILKHTGIIANPNCSTIQMVVALKSIYDTYGISRIIVSTYQAVSGTGQKAINELTVQTKQLLNGEEATKEVYPHTIAFNAIPQIDDFLESGFTKEEMKMTNETKKIFGDTNINVTATCVRIPVFNGHSESIYIETIRPFELSEVVHLLETSEGVKLVDDPDKLHYPLASDANGSGETLVGRVRKDLFHPQGLNMWVVADNLLKGAALNAVQIAEKLIEKQQ